MKTDTHIINITKTHTLNQSFILIVSLYQMLCGGDEMPMKGWKLGQLTFEPDKQTRGLKLEETG